MNEANGVTISIHIWVASTTFKLEKKIIIKKKFADQFRRWKINCLGCYCSFFQNTSKVYWFFKYWWLNRKNHIKIYQINRLSDQINKIIFFLVNKWEIQVNVFMVMLIRSSDSIFNPMSYNRSKYSLMLVGRDDNGAACCLLTSSIFLLVSIFLTSSYPPPITNFWNIHVPSHMWNI